MRLAAHPIRWRLLSALAATDLRVRELIGVVDEQQSLVSYHLRLLRDAGMVTANRSTLDGRDSYYHLDLDRCADQLAASGGALHPALRQSLATGVADAQAAYRPVAVLFVCTGNSARSPIAEALLRQATRGQVEVVSAGSHPKPRIHADAVRVLRDQFDIDLADQRPRHLDEVADRRFDFVVTLCDKAREVCPELTDHPIHWSLPDPAAAGSDAAFADTAREIHTRVRHLLPLLRTTL